MLVNWVKLSESIGVLKIFYIGRVDVTFNQDACRIPTGQSPQNLSLLRPIALNALNLEQSFKRSNRQKSNRAAMDNNYMLTILAACLYLHNDASKSSCQ